MGNVECGGWMGDGVLDSSMDQTAFLSFCLVLFVGWLVDWMVGWFW